MRCERCRGLMVVDYFIDMQDSSGHLWLRAWRCVNCGEVVDPGITHHRIAQRSGLACLLQRLETRLPNRYERVPPGGSRLCQLQPS